MQAFKLFFKVLKKQRVVFVMYIAIFCAILFGVLIPQTTKDSNKSYTEQRCKYAILDEDDSRLSKSLAAALENSHEKVEIKSFEKDALQDELYARNIRAAVVIKAGFEKAFSDGKAKDYLVIYDVPADSASRLFTGDVDEYLRYTEGFIKAGYTANEAADKAADVSKTTADVEIYGEKSKTATNGISTFYRYLGWIFITMFACAIAPVMVVLDKQDIRRRIECSAFEFSKMNGQIVLGAIVVGIGVCALFGIFGKLYFQAAFDGIQAALFMLNSLCYAFVALSFAFMISKMTSHDMTINMIANVVGLGMSFLSGVFVPMYLLSDVVISIAHFLPSYWYLIAIENIELYTAGKMNTILSCYGIEILFGALFVVIGVVVANRKRVKA